MDMNAIPDLGLIADTMELVIVFAVICVIIGLIITWRID